MYLKGRTENMESWRVSTALIMIVMFVMFVIEGLLFGYFLGMLSPAITPLNCAVVTSCIAALVVVYCHMMPVDPVLRHYNATEVTQDTSPRIYGIVEGLAHKAGTPMPKVYVCDVDFPNAFALGKTPDKALVAVTAPLMDMLDDDELEAVMGHELSHVIHRDTFVNGVARICARILTTSAIVMGITSYALTMALGSGSSSKGGNGGGILFLLMAAIFIPIILLGLVLCLMLPAASAILKFGVSRNREYGADESSARMTGKPMALVTALLRMENGCSKRNRFKRSTDAHLWITNPLGRKKRKLIDSILSTHPTTESRVERLLKLEEEINGTDVSEYRRLLRQ